jgi:hypothetical protein
LWFGKTSLNIDTFHKNCVGVEFKKIRWGRGDVCTGFWWGSLRERDHWEDPDVDGRIILIWIFRK